MHLKSSFQIENLILSKLVLKVQKYALTEVYSEYLELAIKMHRGLEHTIMNYYTEPEVKGRELVLNYFVQHEE